MAVHLNETPQISGMDTAKRINRTATTVARLCSKAVWAAEYTAECSTFATPANFHREQTVATAAIVAMPDLERTCTARVGYRAAVTAADATALATVLAMVVLAKAKRPQRRSL